MKRPLDTPGPVYSAIRPDELLPLPVVKARLRWGNKTIAAAQRDGLRVFRYAKWGYCVGADLIRFLEQQAAGPAATDAEQQAHGTAGDVEGNGDA